MNRNKIACNCKNVSYGMIEDVIVNGARSYEEVEEKLKFGTGCGQCREFIRYLIKELLENYPTKKVIGEIVKVTVDRPIGSYHPEHKDIYYPINYGYIEGIIAQDGEEQDAYILGINEAVTEFIGKVIAIIHRNDDVEDKWVVAPENMKFTKEEIKKQVYFQEQYFDFEIIM